MVLLMQRTKIVNLAYNAIDVDYVAQELNNIIDRICVGQCLCLCAFHHVIPQQAVGLRVCRSIGSGASNYMHKPILLLQCDC